MLLPPFKIIRYSNILEELKHLNFGQNYRENYKDLWYQIDTYYENIINEESNDSYLLS
jgi:hypothetical protein